MNITDLKPEWGPQNKRAGGLLLALSFLSIVLGAAGIATKDVPDFFRNHACLATIALIGVVLAVCAGVYAGWVAAPNSKEESIVLRAGLLFLLLGLVGAAAGGVANATDRPQPSVTAALKPTENGPVLDVAVRDAGLKATDDLSIAVEPLYPPPGDDPSQTARVGRPLYSATLGPDGNGDVERSFSVDLPPGRYEDVGVRAWVAQQETDCYDQRTTTGCVLVHLNRQPEQPQLSAEWSKEPGQDQLVVTLEAHDIPGAAMSFAAVGMGVQRLVLARARFAPDSTGALERSVTIPVTGRLGSVCVVAVLGTDNVSCPAGDSGASWLVLPVPQPG